MNLIVIYGPPAVGKLTVAKQLAEKTGYKLLHNHLTVDVVTSVFDFDSEQLPKLLNKIRLEVLTEAASSNIEGVILTLVYESAEAEDDFIRDLISVIKSHKGNILFVRLYADKSELEKRIVEESRAKFNKPRSLEILNSMMGKYNVFAEIPYRNSFFVDNTNLLPEEVADRIVNHFGLK